MIPFITPGLAFLGRGIVYFSVYLGSIFYSIQRISTQFEYPIPTWVIVAGVLAATLPLARLYVLVRDLKRSRRAAELGARLVPKVVGKRIGNLDVMGIALRNVEIGYPGLLSASCYLGYITHVFPGDGITERIAEHGPTFNFNILYSELVLTTCPEHIKLILATDFTNYEKGGMSAHLKQGELTLLIR